MGAMNGGIPLETIKSLTRKYLSALNDLDVEVYDFDLNVPCDLYNALEYIVNEDIYTPSELENMSNIKARYWIKIIDAVKDGKIKSVNNLCNYIVNGKRIIGKTNIERLYVFLTKYKEGKIIEQNSLF